MARNSVKTALSFVGVRTGTPKMVSPYVQMLEQTEVVDYVWMWDIISGWFPRSIWTPDVTPNANVLSDIDSWYDMRVQMGMAAAVATKIGLLGVMPSLRHGPAEMMQTMMTMTDAVDGNAIFGVGVGEAYNSTPFGYNRGQGLAKFEDHMRLYKLLWECDGPFDFEGNVWQFRDAYIGTMRNQRPKIYALGAGPKFLDIAAKYADGWMTAMPLAVATPERYAEKVKQVRMLVEQHGRDPDEFGFAIQALVVTHEDRAVIESAYDSPTMKLFVATWGRFDQADWELEGLDPVFPRDWNYSVKWLPNRVTREEALRIIERVPREMVERSWPISGTPSEVAASLGGFIEAGATTVCLLDLLPYDLGLTEAMPSVGRCVEICRLLKESSS